MYIFPCQSATRLPIATAWDHTGQLDNKVDLLIRGKKRSYNPDL